VDFVQDPYFSDKTVEKEKGIIGQEITMYDDNPDWRLYFGLISNLYKNHPVKIDIAGTIESISHITKELLYECYHTFYHPSNMLLFIVGPIDPKAIMDQVRENQAKKDYKDQPEIQRKFEAEPGEVAQKKQVLEMNVQTSKCLVGIKALHADLSGEAMLKNELTMNVLLDLLFGKSSENYDQLYNKGLIDETFSYDYTLEQGFGFAMIGGDTPEPDQLSEALKSMLFEAKNGKAFSEEQLQRAKKKKIGAFLRAINSPEYIANQFTRYAFNDMNLFDVVPTLEKITLNDMAALASEIIAEERFSVCQVIPKKK
ncbi:MAG: pitrilysin family protein, partial [Bacillota bacterium]|nr:pitrilysin family protein [Bacillota bacterium]